MVDLSEMRDVLDIWQEQGLANEISHEKTEKPRGGRALVQAGISLWQLNTAVASPPYGLTIPNLGSIDVQSLAGAIATGTHGSSLQHGLLSQYVRGLRVVLADGRAVWCHSEKRSDLYRASLVSLGAVGIITEIEYALVPDRNIEWEQRLISLDEAIERWDKDLWTQAEFVRCWWMPYMKRMNLWKASKTRKPKRKPRPGWFGGSLGYHTYQFLLWVAAYIPAINPAVEWFVWGMQNRFSLGLIGTGVDVQRDGLLINCLYSQFVNEWALPLHKGPEALRRLSLWIHGDQHGAQIPYNPRGVWVHTPIEVRVTDGSEQKNYRGFLDPSQPRQPTLYLNAILYRPYGVDPPYAARYYEAFEWLMKDLGGRPHWGKCFSTVSHEELTEMYGDDMTSFLDIRKDVDSEGMFIGAWHRRTLLGSETPPLPLEEHELDRRRHAGGGTEWIGRQLTEQRNPPAAVKGMKSTVSEESFDSFGASTESAEEVTAEEARSTEQELSQ